MRRVVVLGGLLAAAVLAATGPRLADAPKPVVPDVIKDRFTPAPLDQQKIEGLLGQRLRVNLEDRLLRVSESQLLAGFPTRPGSTGASGENAGKFLDAASRTWAYTGDVRLKGMMDRIAGALSASQIADGAYVGDLHWTLAGLLGYYRVTHDAKALETARKIGDMLAASFGDGPGQRSILTAGAHMGLAATSVLEPICTLYRYTGGTHYLDFARYVARAYDQPNGPRLLKTLQESGSVNRVADGKADEILANLSGLVDLYRLTGDEQYAKAAEAAWKDVTAKRLYVTGTVSSSEYFRDDLDLPGEEAASLGEGCATVAWLELNRQLLSLTGDPKYAGEIERTVYNQLLGEQDARTGNISRYAPLVGHKRPAAVLNCAVSSVPCGISTIPEMAWGARDNGVEVLLYAPGEANIPLRPDFAVGLLVATRYPRDGKVVITVRTPRPARFPLFLRVPAWCTFFAASVKGEQSSGEAGQLLKLDRTWRSGDTVEIQMDLPVRVLPGGVSYPNYVALARGPQVLALESELNPQVAYLYRASLKTLQGPQIQLADANDRLPKGWLGGQAYSVEGQFGGNPQSLVLVPFADAANYRVWLVMPGRVRIGQVALTAFGTESWSKTGSVPGSICDERPDTYRTTFEGKPAKEDWYAVEMAKPATIVRIVYRHGKVFENGGWFDTSAGKPKLQIKRAKTGPWETVATLDSYPAYTSARVPVLQDGEPFTVKLPQPVQAVAVRIVGKPARSFSSCAELAAYGD